MLVSVIEMKYDKYLLEPQPIALQNSLNSKYHANKCTFYIVFITYIHEMFIDPCKIYVLAYIYEVWIDIHS